MATRQDEGPPQNKKQCEDCSQALRFDRANKSLGVLSHAGQTSETTIDCPKPFNLFPHIYRFFYAFSKDSDPNSRRTTPYAREQGQTPIRLQPGENRPLWAANQASHERSRSEGNQAQLGPTAARSNPLIRSVNSRRKQARKSGNLRGSTKRPNSVLSRSWGDHSLYCRERGPTPAQPWRGTTTRLPQRNKAKIGANSRLGLLLIPANGTRPTSGQLPPGTTTGHLQGNQAKLRLTPACAHHSPPTRDQV